MATQPRRSGTCRGALLALALLGGLVPASALAQPQPAEQHSGVYLRLSLGLASMQLENEFGADSEFGGTFSFALGYFVVQNLALTLESFGVNAYSFAMPRNGDGSVASEVDARSLAIGISLTYYFPLDFYLSLGPAIGWFQANVKDVDAHMNNARFALDVLAGKEWWIGGSWALGAALQLIYNGADGSVAEVESTWSLGVLFTVTRN